MVNKILKKKKISGTFFAYGKIHTFSAFFFCFKTSTRLITAINVFFISLWMKTPPTAMNFEAVFEAKDSSVTVHSGFNKTLVCRQVRYRHSRLVTVGYIFKLSAVVYKRKLRSKCSFVVYVCNRLRQRVTKPEI